MKGNVHPAITSFIMQLPSWENPPDIRDGLFTKESIVSQTLKDKEVVLISYSGYINLVTKHHIFLLLQLRGETSEICHVGLKSVSASQNPSGSSRGRINWFCPLQVLEATCIPWLVFPSSIFKSRTFCPPLYP